MLKLVNKINSHVSASAAAFGRLCVETGGGRLVVDLLDAAAFGRLCVETLALAILSRSLGQPPSGGCVLKRDRRAVTQRSDPAAAFGRLCVETRCRASRAHFVRWQSPSGEYIFCLYEK